MKSQVNKDSKKMEAAGKAEANETLLQLEAAKKTVESLRFHEAEMVEIAALREEVSQLRSLLKASDEERSKEEKTHSTTQRREAELEAELQQAKACIEELRAEMMDKETELQGISEENEGLNVKLKKIESCCDNKQMIERESTVVVTDGIMADLMDKETELQNVLEENKRLQMEMSERAAEGEAAIKKLEEAGEANREMEAEVRRVKVQCDQWRKAAEAAVGMLWAGSSGRFMERSRSLGGKYGGIQSHYGEEMSDDDVLLKNKKKNGLKKIGVIWKKQQ
ncbi:unnamed protein product [Linum trigynum]|uniref:Interactor of constitutive active ROPs 3-like n=1 Tax=Linum trigynum TaxID=586398 RepID=A0AAV2FZ74_9ROSI